ncbi:hypothetical protein IMG5_069720 [Ichthyophthirius multifiliis]|uniref:Transmembrane protein n=1 Tax=Ichthyophthirius multifiliis TaxID=5932 RepID=G0QPN0_ICHMU|nr:hypothetical protein IMG5_069720 [Ichthyophthirius multifiliis]EGR32830.1 hypothetical protein IMG5_069720 [Ichthyophthirius multifiliis]|eukprot:XP_004036816.1 hypothetical protein IMG5_069720 [Ichthyophthirius multifiliis]
MMSYINKWQEHLLSIMLLLCFQVYFTPICMFFSVFFSINIQQIIAQTFQSNNTFSIQYIYFRHISNFLIILNNRACLIIQKQCFFEYLIRTLTCQCMLFFNVLQNIQIIEIRILLLPY